MTGAEVRKLSNEQIKAELADLRGTLVKLRAQSVTEKVEDNSKFGKAKRDIARLLTEVNARRKAAAKA